MNIAELKAATEAAIKDGDVGFDHWRDNLNPVIVLKLITLVDAAGNWLLTHSNQAHDKLYEIHKELTK